MSDKEIIYLLRYLVETDCSMHQQALLRSLEAAGASDRVAQVLGAQSLFLLGFEPQT